MLHKHPYGPATKFSATSNGGEYKINDVYHTRYNEQFGKKTFEPRVGQHKGTGYHNLRPQIFYKQTLDHLDNPFMGQLCSRNYESIMKKSFNATCGPDGRDQLPNNAFENGVTTGFTEEKVLSGVPKLKEVIDVHFNTRKYGGISHPGLEPLKKIQLEKLQRKDPNVIDNYSHGPSYMKSDMKTNFVVHSPQVRTDGKIKGDVKQIGKITNSGWRENKTVEPITFNADNNHDNLDKDGKDTCRPTGISTTSTSYQNWKDQCGRELNPSLINLSTKANSYNRDTNLRVRSLDRGGYTSLDGYPKMRADIIRKNDPQEYSNMLLPHHKKSTARHNYKGLQRAEKSEEQILNTQNVGLKELSGDAINNSRYFPSGEVPSYMTQYNYKFIDPSPAGPNRQGWTVGGVQPLKRDGFNFSTKLHGNQGSDYKNLQDLHPFVARTIKKEDQFYGEQKHGHKQNTRSALHGANF